MMEAESNHKIRTLKEMGIYMGRKLNDEQIKLYIRALSNVPAQYLADLCRAHMSDCPPGIPSKFLTVTQIQEKWNLVRSISRNTAQSFRREACDDCRGEGMVWYRVPDDGSTSGFYERVAKCGNCRNWRQHGPMPRLDFRTKAELVNMGFEVYPYERGNW
jgi:hypothetical protein